MNYAHYLAAAARAAPGRAAVRDGHRVVTFGELFAASCSLASRLRSLGCEPGDRVADLRENSVESIATDFGCAIALCARVSLNPRLSNDEIEVLLRDCDPKLVLCDASNRDRLRSLRGPTDRVELFAIEEALAGGEVQLDVPAAPNETTLALRYTGGTTGVPKGALRSHGDQIWVATNVLMELCNLGPDDVLLHTQPLSHGAHVFVLPCVMRQSLQVVMPRFRPPDVLETIDRLGVTVLKVVPTGLHRLLDEIERNPSQYSLASLRRIIYGAAPMPPSLLRRAVDRFGPVLAQTYGQTEVPATIAHLTPEDHAEAVRSKPELLRSVGRPYSSVVVKIEGGGGADQPGEVLVAAPMVTSGYWGREPGVCDESGFVRTGDLGYLDERGYLFLVGRSRDIVISGGYNVYPSEVEGVIATLEGVEEVVVLGMPDEEWGERLVAVMVASPTVTCDVLESHCRAELATYKVPKAFHLVDELPRTAAGKHSRDQIRTMIGGGS